MSSQKRGIEERYHAVMQAKQGVPISRIQKMYSISPLTIKRLIRRYDKDGMDGLKERHGIYHPQSVKLSALEDFEKNGLTLREICSKYDISYTTFGRWKVMYEAYKKGDKFALNGNGAVHKEDIYYPMTQQSYQPTTAVKKQDMSESKERTERRKAISNLSRKELQEILLDREAELDILKKLEALDQEREMRRHAIWHKSSKD